jgi:hypothetical protein
LIGRSREAAVKTTIDAALRTHHQWFGSYKQSGELKKVHVWLTVRDGLIEFLSGADSYKVKRVRRNTRVVCFLGAENGPAIHGLAEIITDPSAIRRTYRAYWKAHPIMMLFLAPTMSRRIKDGTQVMLRVRPDESNILAGVTDPIID